MVENIQVIHIEKSLRKISEMLKQKGREILTDFPITTPQFLALQILAENGDMTIGDLSTKMFLACSTTTDLIDRMEKNELVERVKDQADRRIVRIHLLNKGTQIIREVLVRRHEYLKEILQDFSEEEVIFLEKSLYVLFKEMERTMQPSLQTK